MLDESRLNFQAVTPMPTKPSLIGMNLQELADLVRNLGQPVFRAKQLYRAIYDRGVRDFTEMSELSKPLRATIHKQWSLAAPTIQETFRSRDQTTRYLFEVGPKDRIEAVLIPEAKRDTYCISSQVGCAVACPFCVTATLGLRRNLTAGEIVAQVLTLRRERPSRPHNVVFMGMGEPLHNYDAVMKAIQLMTDPNGLAIPTRRITLSTSGVVPSILRLATEPVLPNLAISLNATTDRTRTQLIPINQKWNIASLLAACRKFPAERRRRITFEYVLIDGVNDTLEDARRLKTLLTGFPTRVNLIPLNADPWIALKPSPSPRVAAFQNFLRAKGMTVHRRRPRGEDVSAACGMLAGREMARAQPSDAEIPNETATLAKPLQL